MLVYQSAPFIQSDVPFLRGGAWLCGLGLVPEIHWSPVRITGLADWCCCLAPERGPYPPGTLAEPKLPLTCKCPCASHGEQDGTGDKSIFKWSGGVTQYMEQLGSKVLLKAPKNDITLLTMRLEPMTFRSQAQSLNPQSDMTLMSDLHY